MNKTSLKFAALTIIVLTVAASSYFSPYWMLYQLRSSIKNKDTAAFSEQVDFASIRSSLRPQVMKAIEKKMNDPSMAENPFAELGKMLIAPFVDKMLDDMISPEGIMKMMTQDNHPASSAKPISADSSHATPQESKNTESQNGEAERGKLDTLSLHYEGWSTVKARSDTANSRSAAIIFRRDGLWSWKLSAIELPEGL